MHAHLHIHIRIINHSIYLVRATYQNLHLVWLCLCVGLMMSLHEAQSPNTTEYSCQTPPLLSPASQLHSLLFIFMFRQKKTKQSQQALRGKRCVCPVGERWRHAGSRPARGGDLPLQRTWRHLNSHRRHWHKRQRTRERRRSMRRRCCRRYRRYRRYHRYARGLGLARLWANRSPRAICGAF